MVSLAPPQPPKLGRNLAMVLLDLSPAPLAVGDGRIGLHPAARGHGAASRTHPLFCSWAASPWATGPVIGLG
jgi:hypothetical protein